MTNQSSFSIRIVNIGREDSNFSVTSHNCPLAPENFVAGAICTIRVKFKPLSGGKLNWPLEISYTGSKETETVYSTTSTVSGTGVSPLSFDGVTEVTNVSTTGASIRWEPTDTRSCRKENNQQRSN